MKSKGSRKNVAIIGATSAIAKAYLSERASSCGRIALCARNAGELAALAQDIQARHPEAIVQSWTGDVGDMAGAERIWREMAQFCHRVDEVVVAPGILGEQGALEADPRSAFDLVVVNSAAVTAWVLWAANTLEAQRHGAMGVITSVAGVRGRASNYVYGSSKAQLIALCSGLRCRLARSGVRLVDFRPGMVDTPMTSGLRKGPLMARASTVGGALARAMSGGQGVVYSPGFWRAIMGVIRTIPYPIFKKLKF